MGNICERRRVVINKENYYITVGKTFVHGTVPYENRKDREDERLVVETICKEITRSLRRQHGLPEEEEDDN